MELTENTQNGTLIVGAVGRIDSAVAKDFEAQMLAVLDRGTSKLIFDCSRLDYISSAGLRVLLITAKRLKGIQGKFVLCGMNAMIREVFDVSGFSSMLTITSSADEGLKLMS